MRLAALFALLMALPLCMPARAEVQAGQVAAQAAEDLRTAINALKAAQGGKDRIAALTQTIRAYEAGLAVLRDAMRAAAVRQAEIAANFESRREEIGQLLGVMTAMEQAPQPMLLLHPSGPLGTARSAMILSAVAPALQSEAEKLRGQLREMKNIQALQKETADMLAKGLDAVQNARTALAQAIQDRTDLPRRYLDDPAELQTLKDNVQTLDAFAEGLSQLETDIGAPVTDFAALEGRLALPVYGKLLRRAGEADAAGITRPGMVIATRPAALVTSPWSATIRYRGPLLDYGNVMIIEPANGYLIVLAGLGTVFGETGDVVPEGAPLGLMGGQENTDSALSGQDEEVSGEARSETLYIELRKAGTTIDPGPWFAETKGS